MDETRLHRFYQGKLGVPDEDSYYVEEMGILYNIDGFAIEASRYPWMTLSDIGFKAVTAAVSDIYARGGIPSTIMVSIGVGKPDEAVELMKGVAEAAEAYQLKLAGGDTNRAAGSGWIDVFVDGRPLREPPPGRRGARPGDVVVQVGKMGLGSAAYHIYRRGLGIDGFPDIREWSTRPVLPPWLPYIVSHDCVKASIDNSDGAYRSLYILSQASNVAISVERLFFDEEALRVASPEELAVSGGEDFNLFVIAGRRCLDGLLEHCSMLGGVCGVVGRVLEGEGVYVDGRRVESGGWRWF